MQVGQSFIGASFQRRSMREWFTTRAAADLDILPSLPLLRDRSRDLARNDPLASGAISKVVENVIGTGLSLQAARTLTR
jgi:capsid protein